MDYFVSASMICLVMIQSNCWLVQINNEFLSISIFISISILELLIIKYIGVWGNGNL